MVDGRDDADHDGADTRALEHTAEHEQGQGWTQGRAHRADDQQRSGGAQHRPMTADVCDPTGHRECDRPGQQIGDEHPCHLHPRQLEIKSNARQRHTDRGGPEGSGRERAPEQQTEPQRPNSGIVSPLVQRRARPHRCTLSHLTMSDF
jgi:hypothetical protein